MTGRVLAVSGLAREARIAAGPGVEAVQAGGSPLRLRALLAARDGSPPRAVMSFGIAGGLDPTLRPGDLVVGCAVRAGTTRLSADPDIVKRVAERLAPLRVRVVVAEVAGTEHAVATPGEKAALWREGASVVDMESHVAAAYAAEQGCPLAILRVVCDPAERALPTFAAEALKPNGEPDVMGVLAALLRGETRPSALARLAQDSGAAFRSLGRARSLLGFALGVGA